METTKLNAGVVLTPEEVVTIDMSQELDEQIGLARTVQAMATVDPSAEAILSDYNRFLEQHNWNWTSRFPTEEVIAPFVGKKPLWKTKHTEGFAVKGTDGDLYVILQASPELAGYRNTQLVMTLGGAM